MDKDGKLSEEERKEIERGTIIIRKNCINCKYFDKEDFQCIWGVYKTEKHKKPEDRGCSLWDYKGIEE